MNTTAIFIGFIFATGTGLIGTWFVSRRPTLQHRVAPQLRASGGRDLRATATASPLGTLERLLAPVLKDGVRAVERWGASATDIASRLGRAGSSLTVERYRVEQVVWGVAALALGLVLSLGLAATRGSSPVALLMLTLLVGLAGVAGRDYALSRAIAKREARMLAELPTVAELLALSVGAGEGALGALERVSRSTHGELATELRRTLAEARTGTPLAQALHRLADRSGVPALSRFADGVAVAVERGTPLADVLRAQAQDVRESGRRALMEQGGKKEIAMMIPVVFLILPVTVVFAVFPGVLAIRLGT